MRPILSLLTLGLASLAAVESRDPWAWPFARTSIWNTPRGADAVLIPAHLPERVDGALAHIGIDVERHVVVPAGAPSRPVYPPSSWGRRWPGDTAFQWRQGVQWTMPLPDDFRQADAEPPHTPNACISFLMPDGRSLRQLEPTCRLWEDAVSDRRIIGWPAEPVDLYGDGRHGAHWGSGLSVLGGSLRVGELTGAAPIRHALKLNIWGRHLFHDAATRGFRWPADRADAYAAAGGYQGSLPALRMGALLVLPADLTPGSLGIGSEPGRKLFAALRDYGCYISDDSGWNAYDFCAEKGVTTELSAGGTTWGGTGGTFNAEVRALVMALHVVDDSQPDTIGGAGPRMAALAPRLTDPAWEAPSQLNATAAGILTWTAPAGWAVDGYEIARRLGDGAWTLVGSSDGPRWSDPDLPRGVTVRYRVRGTHSVTGNAGAWSGSSTLILSARRIGLRGSADGASLPLDAHLRPDGQALVSEGDWLRATGLDPAADANIALQAATPRGVQ